MTILTEAVLRPVVVGLKVIWKVVVPVLIGTDDEGEAVTVKSEASAPVMLTNGLPDKFKATPPVFSIVKSLTTVPLLMPVEPKSVLSAMIGVISSSGIEMPFPLMLISGAMMVTEAVLVTALQLPEAATK